MPGSSSSINAARVGTAIASVSALAYIFIKMSSSSSKTPNKTTPPEFLSNPNLAQKISPIITNANLSGDVIVKIARQLDFFHTKASLSEDDFVALAQRLVDASKLRTSGEFKVPKVRFGKTELQMPIVTCGGMRCQQTWFPDFIPLLSPRRSKILAGKSQENVKDIVRECLKVGINHFETARWYGTSEMQLVDALSSMIESGEIKREDIIFQTKVPANDTRKGFEKMFANSWNNVEKLGYIDLFSFHCVSDETQVKNVLDDSEDKCYAAALQLKKEGKIRHIGFSTHGTAENIMKLITSEKFEYVNIHYHYFGSYHAEGTPDGQGGHGNWACVKKALELDMGVFNISPCDKGGMLYRPSETIALTIGEKLTPIGFASLHCWKTAGMHTVSVGLARSTDLDEALYAAKLFEEQNFDELKNAEERLKSRSVEKLGEEWAEKGLLNLPTCYEKSTDGMAIGHMLWLHNLMVAYGMHEFCRERYKMLESTGKKWKKGASFEENVKKIPGENAGRTYDPDIDVTEALEKHYNPDLVKQKIAECHEWLSHDDYTEEERKEKGWGRAYNLTTWDQFPGESLSISGVLLQNFTNGWLGITGTGPTDESARRGEEMKEFFQKVVVKE